VLANGEGPYPTGGKARRRSYVMGFEMCDPCVALGKTRRRLDSNLLEEQNARPQALKAS
jgi:hypothetical protein